MPADPKTSPSDVERMLAGLGLRDFRYREFASVNKVKAAMAWPLLRERVEGPNAPAPPPPSREQTLGARILAAEPRAGGTRSAPMPASGTLGAPPHAPSPQPSPAPAPRPLSQPALMRRPLQQVFARLAQREPNPGQVAPGVKSVFKRLG